MTLFTTEQFQINIMLILFSTIGQFVFVSGWMLTQQQADAYDVNHLKCPTYKTSWTASACFRSRLALPTETWSSVRTMAGWYSLQKYWAWSQTGQENPSDMTDSLWNQWLSRDCALFKSKRLSNQIPSLWRRWVCFQWSQTFAVDVQDRRAWL